jgi:hypothetical protein
VILILVGVKMVIYNFVGCFLVILPENIDKISKKNKKDGKKNSKHKVYLSLLVIVCFTIISIMKC